MTELRLILSISFALIFGLVLSCTVRPDPKAEWQDLEKKFGMGSRSFRVFLKYCGSDALPDDQLARAQLCSFKQKLVSVFLSSLNTE